MLPAISEFTKSCGRISISGARPKIDLLKHRVAANSLWSVIKDNLSDIKHDNTSTELLNEMKIVLDDQKRFSLGAKLLDNCFNLTTHFWRNPGRWFVEKKQLSLVGDTPGDLKQPHLPTGEASCFLIRFLFELH